MCVQKWRGKLSTVNLELRLGLSCLTPLSTIFQFHGGGHTDLPQVTEQTMSHNVVLSIPRPRVRFELTTLVVIGTDCICTCSCKSHYHMITTTTAPTDNLPMNDNWATLFYLLIGILTFSLSQIWQKNTVCANIMDSCWSIINYSSESCSLGSRNLIFAIHDVLIYVPSLYERKRKLLADKYFRWPFIRNILLFPVVIILHLPP